MVSWYPFAIQITLHNYHATAVMFTSYACGYISSPEEVDYGQFEATSCATIKQ